MTKLKMDKTINTEKVTLTLFYMWAPACVYMHIYTYAETVKCKTRYMFVLQMLEMPTQN